MSTEARYVGVLGLRVRIKRKSRYIILNVLVHKIVEDLGLDIEKLRGEGSLRVPKA